MTTLPHGRALTRADLEALPDDGRRHELVAGTLLVTPGPSRRHQLVAAQLFHLLLHAAPDDLRVLFAPVDVELAEDTVLQPDLLVVRRTDFADDTAPVGPLLAVEILSPSTLHIDLALKKTLLEEAGCPAYWVVDPDDPSMVAWNLRDGVYLRAADVHGEQPFVTSSPFVVTFAPADLVV